MAFQIQCTNNGCYENTAAELDIKTNEVVCLACNKPVVNITAITKNQLKFQGQIKKVSKEGSSHGVKCEACQSQKMPLITKDKFYCANCNAELKNIPYPFQVLLRTKGSSSL